MFTYVPLEEIDLEEPHPSKEKAAFKKFKKVVNSMLLGKRLTGEITFRLDKKLEDVLIGSTEVKA